MSVWQNRNARVSHPFMGADENGVFTVHRVAADDGGESVAVPRDMEGKFCRVRPVGCAIQYGFGRTNQAPVWNQASALGTGHVQAGGTLADGEFGDGVIPFRADEAGRVYFNHIAESGGSGFIELWISEAAL